MSDLRLRPDWRRRMVAFSDCVRGEAWSWGETDCVSLVRRALADACEEDPLADAPGWTTRIGALRAASRTGGLAAALRAFGATEMPTTAVLTGDVLVMPLGRLDGFSHAALMVGPSRALTSDPDAGVRVLRLRIARREDMTVLRLPGRTVEAAS